MTREELNNLYPDKSNSIESASDDAIRLATDAEYAKENPDKFLNNRWSPNKQYTSENTAKGIYDFLNNHRINALYGAPTTGMSYGAGLGAAGGLAMSFLRGGDHPIRDSLLGAGLGAGAGMLMNLSAKKNYNLQKQSAFSDLGFIQQKIMSEASLSDAEKRDILRKISQLPESKMSELSRLLKTTFGIGIGAILSKFFGGGFFATMGAGIVGGLLGFNSHQAYATDAYGRKKLLNY